MANPLKQKKSPRKWMTAILLGALTLGALTAPLIVHADPGELFPNVAPYDETVSTPISKPERSVRPTPPPPEPPPAPTPAPTPTPTPDVPPSPAPPPAYEPPKTPPPKPKKPRIQKPLDVKPAAEPDVTPGTPPPPLEVLPYADGMLTPMLDADDQKIFDARYAAMISKALAGTVDDRKATAETLETAAKSAPTPDLQRFLLLHSFGLYIRAATPLALRLKKVEALLPLLKDRSLPVVQARADALNDLMETATSNPNERFLDLYLDAHATLAKLQVQAGFPKDAQESIKKAREIAAHYTHKPQTRIDEIIEAAAWCDRSTMAAALWPKLQSTLKATPDDPFTNSMVATLHLSLYANLEQAAVFAARSDRKDLKAFADVIKTDPPHALSDDPAKHALQVLAICEALVDVAKATNPAQLFDRYSIACYAGDHVAQMLADNAIPEDKTAEAQALLVSAREIVDKTPFRRGDDLPRWLDGPSSGAKGAAGKPIASLADVLQAIPRDLMPPDMAWDAKQLQAINDWLAKNLAGQSFDGAALFDRVESPSNDQGKVYVPVLFGLAGSETKDTATIRMTLEDHMSVSLAARAKKLKYEEETPVKGKILSVTITAEGKAVRVKLIMDNKAD